jgi:hypothetical protein
MLAQFIRHARGFITAFEKWLEVQPTDPGK